MSKMKAQTLVDKVVDIAKNHKTPLMRLTQSKPYTGGL